MKTVKRERYSNDFKDRALAMVGLGRPVAEVAQELGIGRASSTAGPWPSARAHKA